MGWETRHGKRVYYRKVRDAAGRVRSVYCGSGERGELAAREDAERRSTRGAGGNATRKKKATADDPPAGAVADGESPQTYSPENSPAAEAVAHGGLTDFRDIKKRGDDGADELREDEPGDDAQAPPACSTSDLADLGDPFISTLTRILLIQCSAGLIDRTTYQRFLEGPQPRYRKAR